MSSRKMVRIGALELGGGAPIRVESMLKTALDDVEGCAAELRVLEAAGCELVRVAYPSTDLKCELQSVVALTSIPLMADIHFDHRLAISALECGLKSVRINPGNMESGGGLKELLAVARDLGVVIRIGANGGSLGGSLLADNGGDRALALVDAVERQLLPLVDAGFEDVIISAKSSSVPETIRANVILAERHPYPIHVGITEPGGGMEGAVKSASGLAPLLYMGIGDTMRISLTGDSVTEVEVAWGIQRALGIRMRGVNFISCPGCGRRRIDVASLAARVRQILPDGLPDGFSVAVMGCEVNGPREAAAADFGVAGTAGGFVIFRRGVAVATGNREELESKLLSLLRGEVEK